MQYRISTLLSYIFISTFSASVQAASPEEMCFTLRGETDKNDREIILKKSFCTLVPSSSPQDEELILAQAQLEIKQDILGILDTIGCSLEPLEKNLDHSKNKNLTRHMSLVFSTFMPFGFSTPYYLSGPREETKDPHYKEKTHFQALRDFIAMEIPGFLGDYPLRKNSHLEISYKKGKRIEKQISEKIPLFQKILATGSQHQIKHAMHRIARRLDLLHAN